MVDTACLSESHSASRGGSLLDGHKISLWDVPPTSASSWFVIRTRSRQEKVVEAALEGAGMVSWLPLVERVRVYRRSKRRVSLPLFGGYVFARGTREQAWMGSSTERTVGLLEVADQALLHRELCDLRRALEIEGTLDVYPYLIQGVQVRVNAGPLKGVEGIVDSRLGPDRLVMCVQTLGQSTSLEIDPSLLEPVG